MQTLSNAWMINYNELESSYSPGMSVQYLSRTLTLLEMKNKEL